MMLTLSQVALVFFLLTGVTAYSGLREELQEIMAAWTEAFNQHDLEKIPHFYTEDCSVMALGLDVVHGPQGVKKLLKSTIDAGRAKLIFAMEEVGPTDATDTAYDRSNWTAFDEKNNIVAKGKHIVIWKKVEGVWLIYNVMGSNTEALPQMDDDTLKAELEVLNEAYSTVWKAQDLAAIASFYTEDARLMPPEHHTIKGKQAIREAIETLCSSGVADVHHRPEKVCYLGLSKDMAYDRGHYRWLQKDGEAPEEGMYIILWKKVDSQWMIYTSMWSSNPPFEKPHGEL